ncbi:MAG: hypothetical protein OEY51_06795 [Cyclobacteriaceae bacterium]|nr:hypothetical protein [Cyclobacteriaceae bacterium]
MRLGVILSLSLLVITACTWEQIEPVKIPKPKVPVATDVLEASYIANSPNTLKANYWKSADYRVITVSNAIINKVNTEEGALNMNGTYNGLTDFNGGDSVKLTLKAAYDDQNLYILASWGDKSFDLSQNSFLFNGPVDALSGADSAGWTGQRSSDNIVFSFVNGSEKDIWKWSFALSEPLGYAIDMVDNGTVTVDNGDMIFVPNNNGGGLRSGPKYEWNGQQQELVRELGGFTILDPGFYLLNKTPFTGDVVRGDSVFHAKCAKCHGVLGDGNGYEWETGVALNLPGFYNRIARGSFEALLTANSHSGKTYWDSLTPIDKEDLIARIRGFAGVPGYYLDNATGNFPDVQAVSNIALAKVNTLKANDTGYQVLLVRKLNTTHNDDIQFDSTLGDYTYNVYLSDNDNLNMIGAENEKLIFK